MTTTSQAEPDCRLISMCLSNILFLCDELGSQTQGSVGYPTIQRSVVRVWCLVPVETDLAKPEEQFHGKLKGRRFRPNTLSPSVEG